MFRGGKNKASMEKHPDPTKSFFSEDFKYFFFCHMVDVLLEGSAVVNVSNSLK